MKAADVKDILVPGGTVSTTDDVATAVLAYSAALSRVNDVGVVDYPAVVHGAATTVKMIVGAGSAMTIVNADDYLVELPGSDEDARFIRVLTDQVTDRRPQ